MLTVSMCSACEYMIYILYKKVYQVRRHGWLWIVTLAPPSHISIIACIDTILSPPFYVLCLCFFLTLFSTWALEAKEEHSFSKSWLYQDGRLLLTSVLLSCVFYTCACDFISVTACLRVLLWENISTNGNPTQLYSLEAALKPYLKIYLYSLALYVHTLLSNAHGVKKYPEETLWKVI